MWEHILSAQLLLAREVLVPPFREPTILLVQILVQELVLFLNHEPWFFMWSNLGNPNLTGLVGLIDTADSEFMHHQYQLFPPSVESWSGAQEGRARLRPIRLRPAGFFELGPFDLGQFDLGQFDLGQKKSHRDFVRLRHWGRDKQYSPCFLVKTSPATFSQEDGLCPLGV